MIVNKKLQWLAFGAILLLMVLFATTLFLANSYLHEKNENKLLNYVNEGQSKVIKNQQESIDSQGTIITNQRETIDKLKETMLSQDRVINLQQSIILDNMSKGE